MSTDHCTAATCVYKSLTALSETLPENQILCNISIYTSLLICTLHLSLIPVMCMVSSSRYNVLYISDFYYKMFEQVELLNP